MFKVLLRVCPAMLLTFALSGCGVIDMFYLPPAEDTVREIFDAGNDAMLEKEYSQAIKYFAKVKDEYPFSPYAIESELNLGDAYFMRKQYLEAADAYKNFEELHPRNEAIPYVLFQIGMSLKNTYVSVDRTTSEAAEAITYFKRLMQSYPDSEYAQQAPEEIAACRRILAERELFTANVFWNMGNSGAAFKRYVYVYENFSDVPGVKEYSESKAKIAYLKYRETSTELERREIEGSWHKWFDWL